jgi:hypothetical protein
LCLNLKIIKMMMMRQQQQYQQYQQPLATPSEPRPIPINGSRPSNNRLHTATSSSELLSKSLGDMPTLATALQRYVRSSFGCLFFSVYSRVHVLQ